MTDTNQVDDDDESTFRDEVHIILDNNDKWEAAHYCGNSLILHTLIEDQLDTLPLDRQAELRTTIKSMEAIIEAIFHTCQHYQKVLKYIDEDAE